MTTVSEIMTRGVRSLSPSDSVLMAAQAMDEMNIGAVPVCDGKRLVGMVTDRDITVRGVAQGRANEDTKLKDIMSPDVKWCFEDQRIEEVLDEMASGQIRRLPVVDRERHLVGMITLGDIAAKTGHAEVGESLGDISEPASPDRSGNSAASGSAGGGSASGQPSRMPGLDRG